MNRLNYFERHDKATQLSDTHTAYSLARMLIKAVEDNIEWADNGCGNDLDFERTLKRFTKK